MTKLLNTSIMNLDKGDPNRQQYFFTSFIILFYTFLPADVYIKHGYYIKIAFYLKPV